MTVQEFYGKINTVEHSRIAVFDGSLIYDAGQAIYSYRVLPDGTLFPLDVQSREFLITLVV